MTSIAISCKPCVINEDMRPFRFGHPGKLGDVAELDRVVLAMSHGKPDGAAVLWLEQVIQRGYRAVVQIRCGGPDPFERPGDVPQSCEPTDLLFGRSSRPRCSPGSPSILA